MRFVFITLLMLTTAAVAQNEQLLPVMQNGDGVITSASRQDLSKRFAAANGLVGTGDATYTATVARAAAALQTNAVSFTSSFVNVEAGTTSRLVVINGRVTQFNIP